MCLHVNYQSVQIECKRGCSKHQLLLTFQTDSDEDVVFVSEKSAAKPVQITVNLEKLLALQRDIDEQSQPTQPAKPLTSHMISAEAKMEGENGEANIIKKKKKQKRGHICSPEIQICAAENGSQAKTKKKRKKVETVAKEKEDQTDQKKDKKKTKRKKHDGVSSTIETDDDNKRKKPPIGDGVIQAENSTLKAKKLEKKKRKEEKLKDKCVQIKPENMKVEEDKEMQIGSNHRKKPKKEKGKVLVSRTAETKEIVVKKKKKTPVITDGVDEIKAKKKAKVLENGIKVEKEESEVSKVKLKRKKEKESKSEGFGNEVKAKRERLTENGKILPKEKNKLIAAEEDLSEVKIKKKKKSKKAKEEDGEVEAEEMEPQKKKKKIVKKNEGVKDSVTLAAEPQSSRSKKKKNSAKADQDMNTEAKATGKKKKKNKEEQEDSQDFPKGDVVFLSAKTGNIDEVAINQERRKALQMEIEEASQPHKPDKPAALGQWSTAQFDNSQQQQKFLRLMGGFKKGFQLTGTTAGGAIMALGKDAQQHLQQGLLGEFERAHARKMDFSNRGAGLGFTAPSNKKFSIDINASRSVRFDD